MFDASGLLEFLIKEDETGRARTKLIMGDLGHLGINRSGARALLPHKRVRGHDLLEVQKEENRILSCDRIIVENFFGRWKSLFGICQGKYHMSLSHRSRIIQITILMTNWYIGRHPLRRPDEERVDELSEENELHPTCAFELDKESSSDDD
jgi:hypothetical protein